MKKCLIFAAIFFLVFYLTTHLLILCAEDIDLVKLKKEEEERRKKLKKQNKKSVVVTNETLKQYGDAKKSDETKKPEIKNQPGPEKPEKVDPKKTKEYWQGLKKDLEKKVKDLRETISNNESELNKVTSEYLIIDLPFEKEQLLQKKIQMEKILEGEKATLKKLQEEFAALPEKARKAGVPPGWIR